MIFSNFTTGEALSLLFQVGTAVAIIATLKADLKSIKELFQKHEEYDTERFDQIREDFREFKYYQKD